jgi:hypothetical protein
MNKKIENFGEWMTTQSLEDKIAYASPVHIQLDDDFAVWTVTLDSGEFFVGDTLDEALNQAVLFTDRELDKYLDEHMPGVAFEEPSEPVDQL